MPKLPKLSGEELIRILERSGYQCVRTRGSHVRLYPPEGSRLKKVTVPLHKELKTGTLASIMRDANLSIEELS
ncbi:MAG: type II toxin-antitoxin system HicA family toxin [Patescibacteria group bacterium]